MVHACNFNGTEGWLGHWFSESRRDCQLTKWQ